MHSLNINDIGTRHTLPALESLNGTLKHTRLQVVFLLMYEIGE